MYRYVDFHVNSIILDITIPPGPEATPTTTNVLEGGIIIKIISMNEENKGKERSNNNLYYNKNIINHYIFNTEIQVQVDERITLAQLKEELVPLIGVPSTGFIVYRIRYGEEYELEELDDTLEYINSIYSGSKV